MINALKYMILASSKKDSKKSLVTFVFFVVIIMVSCGTPVDSGSKETDSEELEWSEITNISPIPPDVMVLRKSIREHGDSMSLEMYLNYYSTYQSIDNDSLLYYSHLMANEYSYSRAYYAMFCFWVGKYNKKRISTRVEDMTFVDSAMSCLVEGAKLGVRGCNILLADLYANGIYFERDTTLSNKCLRKAGIINVTKVRKMYEDYYRRENLKLFMRGH